MNTKNDCRIGIMGGTFDPIHNGHLHLALTAMEQLHLTMVLFVPNRVPPHRAHTDCGVEHREAMVSLAIAPYPGFSLSRVEIERPGYSYAVDTVTTLKAQYPEAELFFLTGADSALTVASWVRSAELCQLCHFVAAARPGFDLSRLTQLPECWQQNIQVIPSQEMAVSATEIRRRCRKGESIHGLVPPAVEEYILAHHLYGEPFSRREMDAFVRGKLTEKRYHHCLAVAELAAKWAKLWSLDQSKAYQAGLLHDMARQLSNEEMLQAATKWHIPVNPALQKEPLLLHGPVAAAMAREELGITDEDVLEAIACHTIAKPDMGALAKIIFLADICEPTRKPWPERDTLYQLCEEDLDQAMAAALAHTILYLQERGQEPYPGTSQVLAFYQEKAGNSLKKGE